VLSAALICTASTSLLGCSARRGESENTMADLHPVTGEAGAKARAARLTGLDQLTTRITAQRVSASRDQTPFIWQEFADRPAWRIDYVGVQLRFKSATPGFADRYIRTFSVLLTESTGQLISVSSKFEGTDPDLREPATAVAAEAQLGAEDEIYYGLPSRDPRHSFLMALEIVLNQGIGSPFLAKEIYGNYVLHSRGASPQRAVWVITLRGLPPLPAHGPGADSVPVWQRNHMRNVVDDETGSNLFATNSPQPK